MKLDKLFRKLNKSVVFVIVLILLLALLLLFNNKKSAVLVNGFPQTPVYPKAFLVKSSAQERTDLLFWSNWESKGKVSEIMNWYLDELVKEGWQIDIPPANNLAEDIQYAELIKGDTNQPLDRLQLSIVAQEGGKVKIEVAYPAPILEDVDQIIELY